MRKYVNEIGQKMFTYLLENYSDIGDYGYDFSDLFTMDLTLINRKKRNSYNFKWKLNPYFVSFA